MEGLTKKYERKAQLLKVKLKSMRDSYSFVEREQEYLTTLRQYNLVVEFIEDMKTKYEQENKLFTEWWDKTTAKSDKWTSLERITAHDAWMEAKGVFK